ncbi:hypothetical protein TeGR_g11516 [Tetraparma gracilis]|uniref:Choline transporter-like protein n=1 Tax=Tetraparma gracilis TaxID=2962635 RepID=A0ABQ6M3U0_9STRA|nr:hypothetical protein TeGR_g11516 [Tetraparma gracilis]
MKQGFLPDQGNAYSQQVNTATVELAAPEKKFNDAWCALLFIGHVILIAFIGFTDGVAEVDGSAAAEQPSLDYVYPETDTGSSKYAAEMLGGLCVCVVMGIVLSMIYVKICISLGASLIHVSTKFMIGLYVVLTLINFSVGSVLGGVFCFVFAAILCCWYYAVYSRIEFAGANLAVACEALQQFPTLFVAAFAALLLNFGWIVLWCLAMLGTIKPSTVSGVETDIGTFDSRLCISTAYDGEYEDGSVNPNPTYFAMLISFYWGSTVISNVMHCTTAGAVATWWFSKDLGMTPVADSFFRACTYSFGSICFGSLLVAILKAIRQMLKEAEKNKNAQMFFCVIQCLLGIIESLLEIFNRYAFCYVAIYGYDFRKAGKAVFDMFKKLGWTTIINDDLIENALSFGAMGVGLIAGLVAYLYSVSVDLSATYTAPMVIVGICIGFGMASVTLSVVSSAVATVFVCFAENPESVFSTHPEQGNKSGVLFTNDDMFGGSD